ncbi:MAG: glycosyltransferase [Actinobacteria bacterium]|nr:glycosyltransferase [Actinomycetota bacterium]
MKPLSPTPLVSVVTPSFNTGRFIEETLRSVQEQDYGRVEHIVLDSGSSDGTAEILARYPAVRVVSEAPTRITDKVNLGFSLAQGEILAWINADDFYLPGAISKAVEALTAHPEAALVYCNYLHVDENSAEIERIRSKQAGFRELIEERNYVPHQTAFFRREALERIGEVDTRYPLVQDWDLWIRISKEFPIVHVDDWWAAFRVSHGQRSDVHKYAFWSQGRKMTRGHGAHFFSPLFRAYWRGKFSRATWMLLRRQFRVFARKLRDFVTSFGRG